MGAENVVGLGLYEVGVLFCTTGAEDLGGLATAVGPPPLGLKTLQTINETSTNENFKCTRHLR